MLKEEDILTSVKARIKGMGKNVKPENRPQPQNKQSNSKQTPAQNTPVAAADVPSQVFRLLARIKE